MAHRVLTDHKETPPANNENRKGCPGCADRLMVWEGVHYVDGEPVMRCEATNGEAKP